jgi:hypothetical protein
VDVVQGAGVRVPTTAVPDCDWHAGGGR